MHHILEQPQGLHPDAFVRVLQVLHNIWQQELKSSCLDEAQSFLLVRQSKASWQQPGVWGAGKGRAGRAGPESKNSLSSA